MKSNVSSIFQEDKWRRHDPNVKWPVRKASAYSTDETLTDKLQEQLWSDDSDISGSVQIWFFPFSTSIRKQLGLICWEISVSNSLNQALTQSKKTQWIWMRLLRDVMLYRGDFPSLGKKIHLNLTPRKTVGVLGGTMGCMRSEYSLNNSDFFIAESNKQESTTESLYAPYSYTFVSQPKAKI